ncbi:hypothetical protein KCU78_g166, partial [Aureobasidium melanogenum]
MPMNGRDTRYLMMGGMNLHVRIMFEDKVTWIARIRRSNATSPPPQLRDRILKSEIQTLLFLEKTNIPTPKVWGYALEGQENPVGVGYILMDCMPGKVLDWSSAPQERKRKIIAQLADIYIELRKHPFSKIGAIEQADEKRVGPLARECLTDFASSDIRPLGPFANLQDYYRASIGLLLGLIHRGEIYTDSPTDMYLLYRDMYEIVPEVYPETAAAHVETYLKHADDKGSHVLVDDEMNITGVIDWEWAFTTADRVAFISPMLLLPVSDFFNGHGVIGEEEELFAKCLEEKGVEDMAKALQGISAAVVWVAGPALLADSVDPGQIGYFTGFMGDSMGLAIIAAPAVGGVVFERIGYNALFYICLSLIGLDVLFRLLVIEKERAGDIGVQHGRDEPDVVYGSETSAAKQEKPSPSPVQKFAFDKKASAESMISDEDACGTVTDTKGWR